MSLELTNTNLDKIELTDAELENVAGGHGHYRHRDYSFCSRGTPVGTTGVTTTGVTTGGTNTGITEYPNGVHKKPEVTLLNQW